MNKDILPILEELNRIVELVEKRGSAQSCTAEMGECDCEECERFEKVSGKKKGVKSKKAVKKMMDEGMVGVIKNLKGMIDEAVKKCDGEESEGFEKMSNLKKGKKSKKAEKKLMEGIGALKDLVDSLIDEEVGGFSGYVKGVMDGNISGVIGMLKANKNLDEFLAYLDKVEEGRAVKDKLVRILLGKYINQ